MSYISMKNSLLQKICYLSLGLQGTCLIFVHLFTIPFYKLSLFKTEHGTVPPQTGMNHMKSRMAADTISTELQTDINWLVRSSEIWNLPVLTSSELFVVLHAFANIFSSGMLWDIIIWGNELFMSALHKLTAEDKFLMKTSQWFSYCWSTHWNNNKKNTLIHILNFFFYEKWCVLVTPLSAHFDGW